MVESADEIVQSHQLRLGTMSPGKDHEFLGEHEIQNT